MGRLDLITGCSAGFGHDAAKHFAAKGDHVHATMRDVGGRNREAAEALRAFADEGRLALDVLEMDVTSDRSVEEAVAGMERVDVLVNNAGLGYGGPVEAFTPEQVLRQLDVNVVGTVRVARAVLPGMRERGSGLVIQVGSVAGRSAFPGFGVYHASKWGLEGLSEAMRYELAPLGIDVVMVEPGPFATSFFGNMVGPADEARAAAYPHVAEFGRGFETMLQDVFADAEAPTDPALVVEAFDRLVETPAGERPFRTVVGLDFGVRALADAVEPHRKQALATLEIADWDGPGGAA